MVPPMKRWKAITIALVVFAVLLFGFTALNYWLSLLWGFSDGVLAIAAALLGMVAAWTAMIVYVRLLARHR